MERKAALPPFLFQETKSSSSGNGTCQYCHYPRSSESGSSPSPSQETNSKPFFLHHFAV